MKSGKKVKFGKRRALIFAVIFATLAFVSVGCASAVTHYIPDDSCIDAGNNTGAPSTDFDGNPRPIDGDGTAITDMGGYEYVPLWPAAQTLFGSDGQNLYVIDPTTGSTTLIGSHQLLEKVGGFNVFGLTFDSEGLLFGAHALSYEDTCLAIIDPSTGEGAPVGNVGFRVNEIAFDPQTNMLYGLAYRIGQTNLLVAIDPATGIGTEVGDTGLYNVVGFAYDPVSKALVAVRIDTGQLYQIDRATAAATPLAISFPSGYRIRGASIDHTGMLFGFANDAHEVPLGLVSIDLTSGAFSFIGSVDFGLGGLAFGWPLDPWTEINTKLDALIDNVSAADMPYKIKRKLISKLEDAKVLKDNAKIECEEGNFDYATKKLGAAKKLMESFEHMVKGTRQISPTDKASFLAESAKIIEKIDELIEYIETEPGC